MSNDGKHDEKETEKVFVRSQRGGLLWGSQQKRSGRPIGSEVAGQEYQIEKVDEGVRLSAKFTVRPGRLRLDIFFFYKAHTCG